MGSRKEFIGKVLSAKMQKTVVVSVVQSGKHPKYGKVIKKYNKFKVHSEKNDIKVGDLVKIEETKPISKDKRFRLVEIIRKAAATAELKDDDK